MNAEQWPNRLGWTITTARREPRFNVHLIGRVAAITREASDPDSSRGYRTTHFLELGENATLPTIPELVCDLCQRLWQDRRSQWQPAED